MNRHVLRFAAVLLISISAGAQAQMSGVYDLGDDFPGFGAPPRQPPVRPDPPVPGCQDTKPLSFKPSPPNAVPRGKLNDLDGWKTQFETDLGLLKPVNVAPTPCDIWLPDGSGGFVDKTGVAYRDPPVDGAAWTCTVRIEQNYVKRCSPRKLKWLLAHEMCHCQQLERGDPQPLNENAANQCADQLLAPKPKTAAYSPAADEPVEACEAEVSVVE